MGPLELTAIVGVGLVAGIVNTLVGGGTSIVLPLLILLGVDPRIANGTNRMCVAFQAGAAAITLHGKTGATAKTTLAPVIAAVLGSIPGAALAGVLDPTLFRQVLGWILLLGVALFFVPKRRPADEDSSSDEAPPFPSDERRFPIPGLVVTFLFGVYGGFVGAGIGVLIMLYLPRLLGLPMVRMLQVKVWMVLALSAASGVVFLIGGWVDFVVASALLPAYVAGGILGARIALRGGEKWIRRAVAGVAALLALAIITGLKP